jgi:hypothetical protein
VHHHGPHDDTDDGEHRVTVEGAATFLCVPTLSRVLAGIPSGADTRVELRAHYLDHAARDHLDAWAVRQRAGGARVVVTDREPVPNARRLRVGPLAGAGEQRTRLAEPRRPLGYAEPARRDRLERDLSERDTSQLDTAELDLSRPGSSRRVGDMSARHRRG